MAASMNILDDKKTEINQLIELMKAELNKVKADLKDELEKENADAEKCGRSKFWPLGIGYYYASHSRVL